MADYEKQFQEDLERAQALSLESLALEQFKNKKLQELNRSATTATSSTRPKTTTGEYFNHMDYNFKFNFSVARASSMSETDSASIRFERQLSKSRPRPGHSHSPSSSLIAPPPSSQNKNNSANESPDLISFSNPPPPPLVPEDLFQRNFSATPK